MVTRASSTVPEADVAASGITLVVGPETLLAEQAVAAVLGAVRDAEERDGIPAGERAVVTRMPAAELDAGTMAQLLSPSLFGERRVVVVEGLADLADPAAGSLRGYLREPADDIVLVLVHRGGARGKNLLDAARAAATSVVDCPALKYDSDKIAFVQAMVRRARRDITPEAARGLVDALGADLPELAAGVAQLLSDTTGTVDASAVDTYYGGRVETSGFKIADAALEGRAGEALRLLRHGLALGLAPVLVTSALASGLRTLARVASAGRGVRSADLARDLGVAPFQVDKARRQASGWSAEGVARAITAVAQADAEVKGAATDPGYSLERAVVTVASARG